MVGDPQSQNVKVNGEDALAYTGLVDSGTACAIHVNPLLSDGSDTVLAKVAMAHEMFHCFQGDWLRKLGHVDAVIPAGSSTARRTGPPRTSPDPHPMDRTAGATT